MGSTHSTTGSGLPVFHNSLRSLQDGCRDELGCPGRGSPFPPVPPGGQVQCPNSQMSWCRGPSGWRSALLQLGKLLVSLSQWSLGVSYMTTGARFSYSTTGAGCTCSTTKARDSKTGAVTNKGGADSAGRSAAISTTSTNSVPPGGQVQCPNSKASGSQGSQRFFLTICNCGNSTINSTACTCGTITTSTTRTTTTLWMYSNCGIYIIIRTSGPVVKQQQQASQQLVQDLPCWISTGFRTVCPVRLTPLLLWELELRK